MILHSREDMKNCCDLAITLDWIAIYRFRILTNTIYSDKINMTLICAAFLLSALECLFRATGS